MPIDMNSLQTQISGLDSTKADSIHDHDSNYYTKVQVDSLVTSSGGSNEISDRFITEWLINDNIDPNNQAEQDFVTYIIGE